MLRRALIVDDNASNRELLGVMLQRLGIAGVGVGDAQSARAVMAQQRFDLVFLDLKLANGCGLDLAREFRSLPGRERLLLVAVSGVSPEEGARLITRDGFDAFLAKPFSLDELERTIASVMKREG